MEMVSGGPTIVETGIPSRGDGPARRPTNSEHMRRGRDRGRGDGKEEGDANNGEEESGVSVEGEAGGCRGISHGWMLFLK